MRFKLFAVLTGVLLYYAAYQALWATPPIKVPATPGKEIELGNIFRIFYYHVPSAWVAFGCFLVNFIASIVYLVKRTRASDALALATAEVGLVFTSIVLLTGPIWAKPVWGIWWTWDARLTTTLVLWLIYVSYLLLRKFSEGGQTPVYAAVLAIFGFIDVPIVYMSIRWWRTQHPQPVLGGGEGSFITPEIFRVLMLNFAAFAAFAALLIYLRYRLERYRQDIDEAHAVRALQAPERMAR
jgi:heme exporter protein C